MQVQLKKISLDLAGRRVLSDLDLCTDANEYVVILGPSGCGKTTTLRLIAGLLRPDRGEVLLNQTPVTTLSPRQRGVSMVFQHHGLYPHLTVQQSIGLGVAGKLSTSEFRRRLDQAVELARISGLLDRFPDQLSGGELRRAAVAKSVVRQSPVRLLDEPLSALDASSRQSLQDDLRGWHLTVPGTTIHVTHDGFEALRMADRVAILDEGRICQFDVPTRVYDQPGSIAAALAIGSPTINLFPARIDGGSVVSNDPRIRIRIEPLTGLADRKLLIGIRPERLRPLTIDPPSSSGDPVPGLAVTAKLTELRRYVGEFGTGAFDGDAAHSVSAGGGSPGAGAAWIRASLDDTVIHAVTRATASTTRLSPGDEVCLRADRSSLHLFDARSGCRVG